MGKVDEVGVLENVDDVGVLESVGDLDDESLLTKFLSLSFGDVGGVTDGGGGEAHAGDRWRCTV